MDHLHGHVVGLALRRPLWALDSLRILQPLERALKDFRGMVSARATLLLHFEIVAATALHPPCAI